MEFSLEQKDKVSGYLRNLISFVEQSLLEPIRQAGLYDFPQELKDLRTSLSQLNGFIDNREALKLDTLHIPMLRLALDMERRSVAKEQERLRQQTPNAELQTNIEKLSETVNSFLELNKIRETPAYVLPHLTKFLTLDTINVNPPSKRQKVERVLDDKFRVLLAQRTFIPILSELREESKLRNTLVTVVFVDIDNFKAFNTEFGEQRVDREIIPLVMQTIEAHLYLHGEAFRFGGDEYVLLLANLSEELVLSFLGELQIKISQIAVAGRAQGIGTSIGYYVLDAMAQVTDNEALETANFAMRHVKETKKGLIGKAVVDNSGKNHYHIVGVNALNAELAASIKAE